jgi:3-hydroxy-9,10-secoandrosta-1,3,5(10)-triene-9,17-dione monooxygenase reductase component
MTCLTTSTCAVTSSGLRGQLARWPTGVAVITACGDGRPIGKTVNSFHATSLEPPLVGWCIDNLSSQFDEWLAADGYVVHIMAGDQMDLVTRFAKSRSDRFDGLDWTVGLDCMPLLATPVPLRFECRVVDRFAAGDHTYLIGEVVTMTASESVPMALQR